MDVLFNKIYFYESEKIDSEVLFHEEGHVMQNDRAKNGAGFYKSGRRRAGGKFLGWTDENSVCQKRQGGTVCQEKR